jgi:hypothetical protein
VSGLFTIGIIASIYLIYMSINCHLAIIYLPYLLDNELTCRNNLQYANIDIDYSNTITNYFIYFYIRHQMCIFVRC